MSRAESVTVVALVLAACYFAVWLYFVLRLQFVLATADSAAMVATMWIAETALQALEEDEQ